MSFVYTLEMVGVQWRVVVLLAVLLTMSSEMLGPHHCPLSVCRWRITNLFASGAAHILAEQLNRDDTGDFCFVSFGCWGNLNKESQKRVARVMGDVVAGNAMAGGPPTRFVVAAGDNFYRKGVANVREFRFITGFDRVYDHPSLMTLPFYMALGNHDYRGNFFAQVNYTIYQLQRPEASGRWYLPQAYYAARVHREMVVVVLDGPLLERCANNGDAHERCWDHGRQRGWAERQLLDVHRNVRWKVVVCHYPMYANGPHVNFPWLVEWLQPLLDASCATLYINADNHYLQVSHHHGMFFVNSGGGAGFGLRHLPTQKKYREHPYSVFVDFADGVFFHCVNTANDTIHNVAVNHEGVRRFEFWSLGPFKRGCRAGSPSPMRRGDSGASNDDDELHNAALPSVSIAKTPEAAAESAIVVGVVMALVLVTAAVASLNRRRWSPNKEL